MVHEQTITHKLSLSQELSQKLASLDDVDWFTVLEDAKAKRRNRFAGDQLDPDPQPGVSAESFAQWIARRHLAVDPGIREVIYLPTDSPANEIRLLEVNAMLDGLQDEEVLPSDYGTPVEGLDFSVHVADITPQQWQDIQGERLALPPGWKLNNPIFLARTKKA